MARVMIMEKIMVIKEKIMVIKEKIMVIKEKIMVIMGVMIMNILLTLNTIKNTTKTEHIEET